MNDELYLMLACFAGLLLGAVFFGGLWWTVRKCLTTPHPALWLLGSALIRMSITLAGFYFVSDGQWQRLLACLLGFIIARLIVTRLSNAREISVVVDDATSLSNQSRAGHMASSTTSNPTPIACCAKQEASHAS